MTRKTAAITGVVLFLAGLLLGFIPQYLKASRVATQLDAARLETKLAQIRELSALSYMDASKLNYGSAAEASERMFEIAREVAGNTKDESLRNSLNGLLTFHDTVTGKLSAADGSVLTPLQQIVQKTQAELKR